MISQKEAIYTDINELAVYSKMYYDIETVKSDPLIADEYLLSNLPIVGKLTRLKSNRIAVLEKQIKWIETHFYQHHHHGSNNNDRNIKQLKQELAELLEEDAKADKLRRLPLYSCRITGFKFVCSKCYDKVYMYATAKTLIP